MQIVVNVKALGLPIKIFRFYNGGKNTSIEKELVNSELIKDGTVHCISQVVFVSLYKPTVRHALIENKKMMKRLRISGAYDATTEMTTML